MCKYVIKKGKKAGQNCDVKGQEKYNGFCKRHYDRNNKENNDMDESIFIDSNVKTNDNNFRNMSETPRDPYPEIIRKYKPEKVLNIIEEVQPEKREEYSDLYMKYKEGCDIRQEEPIEYEDFNDEEYLKDVANDLENIHAPKFDEKFIKDSLFNLNLVAFSFVEQGSTILKEKYPDKELTDLQGLTRDVYNEEELYKEVLYDIYREHYDVIDEYLSPVTTYVMLSVKSIGMRYSRNKKTT